MIKNWILFLTLLCCSCSEKKETESSKINPIDSTPRTYLQVLGVAQDAGFPQINCKKDCCKNLWEDKSLRKMVSCIGLVDQTSNECYLFDATPDIRDQLNLLKTNPEMNLAGIFLTHAHIGHYTGLMYLGREAMGAKGVLVFAKSRMKKMLEENAPWSQLVKLENIKVMELGEDARTSITSKDKKQIWQIETLLVPHRDEFSETVGYRIVGKSKTALFIPDIDKWEKWDRDIIEAIKKVDYAFLDGTFFQNGEIPGRDMSRIPHPFMEESMERFKNLSALEKGKIYFIHFNHTNPVLQENSAAQEEVEKNGFHIAQEGQIFEL